MPRSASTTPSDSSHDSESPRKRAPSVGDDTMSVDLEASAPRAAFCEHVRDLVQDEQILAHYEKAINLARLLLGGGRGRTKRRKVSTVCHSFCSTLT